MCFRRKKKTKVNQIIKFEQNLCNAKVDDNQVLYVRVKDVIKSPKAYFEIPDTHVGYVSKGGANGRLYQSGNYPVFENDEEIRAWRQGFSIDIVYMPIETYVLILWGTPEKVRYRDEASNKVIEVGARGEFAISIYDHMRFFKKVVGVRAEFDLEKFKERFAGLVVNEFADTFLKVVREQKLTYDQFDAHRKEIGESVGRYLSTKFENDWGVSVCDFIIKYINISKEDTDAIENASAEVQKQNKIKEYLAELERLDDKQWEREKYLRQLELQDRAAYYEVLKVIGQSQAKQAPIPPVSDSLGNSFCPKCGATIKRGDQFCARCGYRVISETTKCPTCGKEMPKNSTFCSTCGTKLK